MKKLICLMIIATALLAGMVSHNHAAFSVKVAESGDTSSDDGGEETDFG